MVNDILNAPLLTHDGRRTEAAFLTNDRRTERKREELSLRLALSRVEC